jgi:type IV pilus assembly protein PilA
MQERIRRVREDRAGDDRGFTLIEMLVVVVIIGILAAIAIPLYMNYRKGAANKSAESDVRGAISAVEQYYTENGNVYPANVNGLLSQNVTFGAAGTTQEIATVSPGNTMSYRYVAAVAAVPAYYYICGYNTDGQTIFLYNSGSGKPVGKATVQTAGAAAANYTACQNTGV